MLTHYLKIALRTLRQQPGYTFINVFGLSVGLACCLLIVLYLQHELRYDRFHEAADRTYRIVLQDESPQTRTPHPMAQALVRDFPEVEHAVSLTPVWGPGLTRPLFTVRHEDRVFEEAGLLAVDTTFFDVFSFPVLAGDGPAALRQPYAVLITRSTAEKYFGEADPLGKTLRINDERDFTVAAVLADVPSASHVHFDFLISYVTLKQAWQGSSFFEWEDFGHYNYVRLASEVPAARIEAAIPTWITRYLDLSPEHRAALDRGDIALRLQPLTDIHLHSNLLWELEPNGNILYVYLFAGAALFILVIACINFMNLATARSASRAREIGVRKSLGAYRLQLARQFLGESLLLSALAVLCALVLVELSLPAFNRLMGTGVALYDAGAGALVALLAGLALGTGLLAGSYPALYLSGFQPTQVLKGKHAAGRQGARLRQGLVVFQFTASIVLIVSTVVISQQLHYLQDQGMGFASEQVVVVPLKDGSVRARYETLKDELRRVPGVVHAAAVSNVPGGRFNRNDVRWRDDEPRVSMSELRVDYDFFETLGLSLVEGRGFSRNFPSDAGSAFILNETAARRFGWPAAVGETVSLLEEDSTYTGPVIGVVADFHHASLHEPITPLILQVDPGTFNYVLVKVRPERILETLAALERTWAAFAPGRAFDYSFLDADFARLYQAERRTRALVGLFSALAVLTACLGLFGLATFAAEQRTKEIGVRKVLGASVPQLVLLLSRDFVVLILLALVAAAPIAYLLMSRWLRDFAYHIDVAPTGFLLAGALALLIALATVSYQAVRAALRNPVQSLRYE